MAKGLCKRHYSKKATKERAEREGRAKRIPNKDENGNPIKCDYPTCGKDRHKSGFCNGHYTQKMRGQEMRPLKHTPKCQVGWCDRNMRYDAEICGYHNSMARNYNITVEQMLKLYATGVCGNPYCDNTEPLDIDHDHSCCPDRGSCGKCIRGLICRECNHALGRVHDSPQKLRGLIEYLEAWEARRP